MHTINLVAEFHRAFDHPIAPRPTMPAADVRLLRFRLIFEEAMEYGRAIGIKGISLADLTQEQFIKALNEQMDLFEINSDSDLDEEGAADALGDIDYVVQGTNLVHGFPAEEIIEEIHVANMSKLGPDGRPLKDAFGKTIKGPRTRKPLLAPILRRAKMG